MPPICLAYVTHAVYLPRKHMQIIFCLSALEYWGILCSWHEGSTADVIAGMQTAFAWSEQQQGRLWYLFLPATLVKTFQSRLDPKPKAEALLWHNRQYICCFSQFCFLHVPVPEPAVRKVCTDRWRSATPQHLYKENQKVISRKTVVKEGLHLILLTAAEWLCFYWRGEEGM